jgi:hypothetical protein
VCLPGGTPIIEANDFDMRGGGTPGTYCSGAPHLSVDPMFVNPGDSTGDGADYHLQPSSPLIAAGVTLPQVIDDHDGVARAPGAYSIGAYQQ